MTPLWVTERDQPWLAELIESYSAFVGEPRRSLDAALAEHASRVPAGTAWSLALRQLDRCFRTRVVANLVPSRARMAVFQAAANRRARSIVLSEVAAEMGVTSDELEESLFADLPGHRRLQEPASPVGTGAVALSCNLAIAQEALRLSSNVVVTLQGNARAIVRHAWLRGLICTRVASAKTGPVALEISGPLSLFQRTTLYGRHLAELVPLLAWCRSFRLDADCILRGESGRFTLRPSDPIPAAAPPARYDSVLERRFAREFMRETSDWILVREPEPVRARNTLVFPDFALIHRRDPTRRWLLEIVGFWTADYLKRKLENLRAARLSRLILCIDSARDCGPDDFPADSSVLRFDKRVDVQAVLAVIEGAPAGSG